VSPNLDALKETERALEESRAQLGMEAAALHQLHELSSRIMVTTDLTTALGDVLGAALTLLGAGMGNIQLLDEERDSLEIVAHRGFEQPFLDHFRRVTDAGASACGRALRNRERVIIEDVDADPAYVPHRGVAAAAGYRAVQSTPLVGRSGKLLGVLSTHFRAPHRPSEGQLRLLDLYARLAAEFVERVRDEATLRQSEERFRTMADNISQFAWMADEKGWIFWYNRRWFDYTGTTLEEMQGWGWTKVHHPDHVDRVVTRIQRSWDTGEVWEDTFPLRGKDGRYRWFLSRATPIRDEAGRVLRWFGTNTDITAQREAEEALRDADRRKDEFLATLAHELRNPLAPVRSSLELMARANGDAGVIEQARLTMDRQMSHLERLVDDLLDVSRITQDKLELRPVPIELASVVHQAVETCRPLLETSRHELSVEVPSESIYLRADPVRLAQVISNLLANACKYTDPGGHVWLRVHRRGDEVEISVKDTGLGIPSDMLPRVFDMFTQLPGQTERQQGGLGIGLTLVRRLAEMHGGRVEAFSEGAGRGSEFVVTLPVLREPIEVAPAPAPAREPAVHGRRILVVDDNRDAAESLALLLSISGHQTRLAHDGQEAIAAAADFRPDVVLLDIGLPKLSGHEAARRIREQPWGKAMVLVALTGWGQDKDRQRSMEIGFDHHLVKPVDLTSIAALLSSLPEGAPLAEAEH
jgi:PAS domain S-box-containing protein